MMLSWFDKIRTPCDIAVIPQISLGTGTIAPPAGWTRRVAVDREIMGN
jgi:hypothetical protein